MKLAFRGISLLSHPLHVYLIKISHVSFLQTKAIGWQEYKRVSKHKYSSTYTITFSGMHVSFEVVCTWSHGEWRWLMNCEKFGVHVNKLGTVEELSKHKVKVKALELMWKILKDHLQEVELQMEKVAEK